MLWVGLNISEVAVAVGGLEYLRSCSELAEKGLHVELYAYKTHVFIDIREVQDNAWRHYAQLNEQLQGRGVSSVDEALRELYYRAVHTPFRMLVSGPAFEWLMMYAAPDPVSARAPMVLEVRHKLLDVLAGVRAVLPAEQVAADEIDDTLATEVTARLQRVLGLPGRLEQVVEAPAAAGDAPVEAYPAEAVAAAEYLLAPWGEDDSVRWGTLFGWLFTYSLGGVVDSDRDADVSLDWYDEWLLRRPLAQALKDLGVETGLRQHAVNTVRMLLTCHHWLPQAAVAEAPHEGNAYSVITRALSRRDVRTYLRVNRFEDAVWFNQEAFDEFVWWLAWVSTIEVGLQRDADLVSYLVMLHQLVQQLKGAEAASGYQVDKLLAALKPENPDLV